MYSIKSVVPICLSSTSLNGASLTELARVFWYRDFYFLVKCLEGNYCLLASYFNSNSGAMVNMVG